MSNPLISVVVPLYNYEQYIGSCLDSLLAQTYPHCEILVVDDGSTDQGALIVQSYQQQNPRIRYFYQAKHKAGQYQMGAAQAFNRGLAEARGEFVAFLAADDEAYPDKLAVQLETFLAVEKTTPRLAAVYSGYGFLIEEPDHFRQYAYPPDLPLKQLQAALASQGSVAGLARVRDYGQLLLPYCLEYNKIHGGTVLCRKTLLDEAGHFDPAFPLCHDYELWLRLMLQGYNFHLLDRPLTVYRIHSSNTQRFAACHQEARQLARQVWEQHPVETLFPPLRQEPSPPLYALAHELLGDVYLQHDYFDIAGQEYQRALTYGARPQLYLKLAACQLRQGHTQEAAANFSQAAAADALQAQALHGLRLCQAGLGTPPLEPPLPPKGPGSPLLTAIGATVEEHDFLVDLSDQLGIAVPRLGFAWCPAAFY